MVFGQRPVEDAGLAQTGPAQAAGSVVTIKPVCPLGEVPVITNSPRGLPKGNPDRPGGVRGDFGTLTGARSDGPADPACDGVTYPDVPGWCYYYAGASDTRTAQGGGHLAAATADGQPMRSRMVAFAMPPPSHMVCRP